MVAKPGVAIKKANSAIVSSRHIAGKTDKGMHQITILCKWLVGEGLGGIRKRQRLLRATNVGGVKVIRVWAPQRGVTVSKFVSLEKFRLNSELDPHLMPSATSKVIK